MDVAVGRVVKTHGLGGEVAVDSQTDSPEQRFVEGTVLRGRSAGGTTRSLTIASVRPHGARLLVRFAEIADRTAAESLRGCLLLADTAELAEIQDPDEFYDYQLDGLRAELTDGSVAGTVTDVVHTPGGELLALERPDGATALVPFVRQIVIEVDVAAGRVVLDPPEGLLDAG